MAFNKKSPFYFISSLVWLEDSVANQKLKYSPFHRLLCTVRTLNNGREL